MSRLLKKKIINLMLNKKKHKFCAEKLLKLNLKLLNKKIKKQYKFIINLAVNRCLPVFQLIKKSTRIKKVKLLKYKPFFILKNKTRIFFSIKSIINSAKKTKLNFSKHIISLNLNDSNLINMNSYNHEQIVIKYKNMLTFYRWT